ncbi:hypothetical protein HN51_011617 [Arachis hypogaea]
MPPPAIPLSAPLTFLLRNCRIVREYMRGLIALLVPSKYRFNQMYPLMKNASQGRYNVFWKPCYVYWI